MNGQQISKEIEKAETQVKNLKEQIDSEQRRLEKFGSKEAYFDYLSKEKEALNELEKLKSQRRSQLMQEIADKEILPRVQALKDSPTSEAKRIELTMEIALYCAAIGKIKTNFIHYDQVNEVLFQFDDPAMALMYGEKREEVKTYLKRIPEAQDVVEIKEEKWVLKDPSKPVTISLSYLRAVALEKSGKGKIAGNTEPVFRETVREDREPGALPLVRRMSLGNPIPGIDGKLSPQAETLQKRCLSGKLEISPMAFTPFVMEHEIKRVLKKFGGE